MINEEKNLEDFRQKWHDELYQEPDMPNAHGYGQTAASKKSEQTSSLSSAANIVSSRSSCHEINERGQSLHFDNVNRLGRDLVGPVVPSDDNTTVKSVPLASSKKRIEETDTARSANELSNDGSKIVQENRQRDSTSTSRLSFQFPATLPQLQQSKEKLDRKKKLDNDGNLKGVVPKPKYNPFSMVDHLLSSSKAFGIEGDQDSSTRKRSLACILSPSEPPLKRHKVSTDERHTQEKNSHVHRRKDSGLVDILIADLDEINEIPFFDISLPRELAMNIFKHFDMIDLCRCAQVSKSWRSLAEDELLWCTLCHEMGYEKEVVTASRDDWKGRVRETYTSDRNLTYNWNNRIGKISTFEYVQGGVLSAGSSRDKLIVGGYTNCHVSLWDLENDTKCVLQPSSTSLILNEGADNDGAVKNFVNNVAVNKHVTAASYNQGLLDIWLNDGDVKPVSSYQAPKPPMTCELCVANDKPVVACSWDRHVRVDSINSENTFYCVDEIDLGGHISHLKLVPRQSYSSIGNSNLLIASTPSYVNLHVPGEPRTNMTTVHEVAQTHVTSLDANEDLVACGVTYYSFLSSCKIFLYNLNTGQEHTILSGFDGSGTKFINLADSPRNKIISADFCRRFFIHDLRQPTPVYREAANFLISTIQMDDWKVVCGGEDGQTAVYDQRMGQKLWEFHNRHPVRYSHFHHDYLVTANIPANHFPEQDDGDQVMMHRRYRGVIQLYNFSVNQNTEGIPSICSSTFDEPIGYDYNINLAMPYDVV